MFYSALLDPPNWSQENALSTVQLPLGSVIMKVSNHLYNSVDSFIAHQIEPVAQLHVGVKFSLIWAFGGTPGSSQSWKCVLLPEPAGSTSLLSSGLVRPQAWYVHPLTLYDSLLLLKNIFSGPRLLILSPSFSPTGKLFSSHLNYYCSTSSSGIKTLPSATNTQQVFFVSRALFCFLLGGKFNCRSCSWVLH